MCDDGRVGGRLPRAAAASGHGLSVGTTELGVDAVSEALPGV